MPQNPAFKRNVIVDKRQIVGENPDKGIKRANAKLLEKEDFLRRHVYLTRSAWDALDIIANFLGISMSELMRRAIDSYIDDVAGHGRYAPSDVVNDRIRASLEGRNLPQFKFEARDFLEDAYLEEHAEGEYDDK